MLLQSFLVAEEYSWSICKMENLNEAAKRIKKKDGRKYKLGIRHLFYYYFVMFLKWMWKSACLSRASQRNSWRIKLHLVVEVCQCNDYVWKHECKPSAACYIVTIKTRRSLLSTKGNKRGMMNACCVCVNAYVSGLTWSCWASWFSSPSTIGANLSLLFLSAAIVIAARILSKLVENREQTQKSTNTFITWLPGHLLTVFTSCILFSLVCWHEHLLSPSLVNLTNSTAFNPFVYNLVLYCFSVQF